MLPIYVVTKNGSEEKILVGMPENGDYTRTLPLPFTEMPKEISGMNVPITPKHSVNVITIPLNTKNASHFQSIVENILRFNR
jgi:hypothetical protein